MKQKGIISGILLLVLSLQLGFSQTKKEIQQVKKKMWETYDPAFKVTKIPDKWKNEAAVVIAKKAIYEYSCSARRFTSKKYFHIRIKLLNQGLVKAYSQFSIYNQGLFEGIPLLMTNPKKTQVILGIKVVKPDGRETEVDFDQDAVKIQNGKVSYKKVAIANLQLGDIIDYYYYVYQSKKLKKFLQPQPTQSFNIVSKLPTLSQNLTVGLSGFIYLKYASLNDAPAFTKRNGTKARNKMKREVYTLNVRNQKGDNNPYWVNQVASYPLVHFQGIVDFRDQEQFAQALKVTTLDSEDPEKYARIPFRPTQPDWFRSLAQRSRAKYNSPLKTLSQKIIAQQVFQAIRFWYYEVDIFLPTSKRKEILAQKLLKHYNFYSNFNYVLDRFEIPYNAIVLLPRTPNSAITPPEPSGFEVFLETKKDRKIIMFPRIHQLSHEIPYQLQGVRGTRLEITKTNYRMKLDPSPCKVSITEADQNGLSASFNVQLKNQQLDMKRTWKVFGAHKINYQVDLLTKLDIANSAFQPDHPALVEGRKKFDAQEANQKRLKRVKRMIENEYEQKIEKVASFELVQPGRTEEYPNLIFKDAFMLNAFVKKVGPNYIIEAGKLIGGQVEIKENQRKRKYDIYMDYPRTFEYTIRFQIPTGYEVKGLDKFNFKVENETGGFISSATKEDNKVIIKSRKFYKHNFEKAKDWGKMVEFLDAAYQFTQQKLLLKPSSK
ncbi:MAG TPA: hypothetical protein DCS93_32200 [Microscillaceae bacterium]|nr:hypothetical protein [Microscillaceae bacterium]